MAAHAVTQRRRLSILEDELAATQQLIDAAQRKLKLLLLMREELDSALSPHANASTDFTATDDDFLQYNHTARASVDEIEPTSSRGDRTLRRNGSQWLTERRRYTYTTGEGVAALLYVPVTNAKRSVGWPPSSRSDPAIAADAPRRLLIHVFRDGRVDVSTERHHIAAAVARTAVEVRVSLAARSGDKGCLLSSTALSDQPSCVVIAAAHGFIPDSTLAVTDASGWLYVYNIDVVHAGRLLTGAATRRRGDGSAVTGDGDSAGARSTRITFSLRCSVQLTGPAAASSAGMGLVINSYSIGSSNYASTVIVGTSRARVLFLSPTTCSVEHEFLIEDNASAAPRSTSFDDPSPSSHCWNGASSDIPGVSLASSAAVDPDAVAGSTSFPGAVAVTGNVHGDTDTLETPNAAYSIDTAGHQQADSATPAFSNTASASMKTPDNVPLVHCKEEASETAIDELCSGSVDSPPRITAMARHNTLLAIATSHGGGSAPLVQFASASSRGLLLDMCEFRPDSSEVTDHSHGVPFVSALAFDATYVTALWVGLSDGDVYVINSRPHAVHAQRRSGHDTTRVQCAVVHRLAHRPRYSFDGSDSSSSGVPFHMPSAVVSIAVMRGYVFVGSSASGVTLYNSTAPLRADGIETVSGGGLELEQLQQASGVQDCSLPDTSAASSSCTDGAAAPFQLQLALSLMEITSASRGLAPVIDYSLAVMLSGGSSVGSHCCFDRPHFDPRAGRSAGAASLDDKSCCRSGEEYLTHTSSSSSTTTTTSLYSSGSDTTTLMFAVQLPPHATPSSPSSVGAIGRLAEYLFSARFPLVIVAILLYVTYQFCVLRRRQQRRSRTAVASPSRHFRRQGDVAAASGDNDDDDDQPISNFADGGAGSYTRMFRIMLDAATLVLARSPMGMVLRSVYLSQWRPKMAEQNAPLSSSDYEAAIDRMMAQQRSSNERGRVRFIPRRPQREASSFVDDDDDDDGFGGSGGEDEDDGAAAAAGVWPRRRAERTSGPFAYLDHNRRASSGGGSASPTGPEAEGDDSGGSSDSSAE